MSDLIHKLLESHETWKEGFDPNGELLSEAATALVAANACIAESEQHRNDLADKIVSQQTEIGAYKARISELESQLTAKTELVTLLRASLAKVEGEGLREGAWQPIETAPKDGTRFLACLDEHVEFFRWQDFGDGWDAPVGWRDSFITVYKEGTGPMHWMPVPPAPAALANQRRGE
ncbi:hypothetical protein PQR71_42430 [Paraburkholderia fungorum]|uniref:hypothetical protein n=1 Tax=Paraburkholderia fungorum TaxID=134537 RepID=UPI0038BC02BC